MTTLAQLFEALAPIGGLAGLAALVTAVRTQRQQSPSERLADDMAVLRAQLDAHMGTEDERWSYVASTLRTLDDRSRLQGERLARLEGRQ